MNVGSRRFGNQSLKVEGFCCGAGLVVTRFASKCRF